MSVLLEETPDTQKELSSSFHLYELNTILEANSQAIRKESSCSSLSIFIV